MLDGLKQPEALSGYVGALNQIGHAFSIGVLALGAVWLLVWIFDRSARPKIAWVGAVGAIYLLCWELTVQGWQGDDTLADTAFVALGAIWAIWVDPRRPWVFFGGALIVTLAAVVVAYGFVK